MKKIVSLALMALTLCIQHESQAMANFRNYAGRIGQQCARLYTQGAQQVVPAYRTFSAGLGQRVSNIRPQISQQFRNIQTSARNWSQNLNLPTARTAALGLGGTGLGAAYLQRPDIFGVVRAEEETPSNIETFSIINAMFDTARSSSDPFKSLFLLKTMTIAYQKEMTLEDRKNFAPIVNNILNRIDREPILREMLFEAIPDSSEQTGNAKFNIHTFETIILGDILLANAANTYNDIQPNQNIEIPTLYKKLFRAIGQDNLFGSALKNTIDEIKKNEVYKSNLGFHRILDEISKEAQKTWSWSWPWPFS